MNEGKNLKRKAEKSQHGQKNTGRAVSSNFALDQVDVFNLSEIRSSIIWCILYKVSDITCCHASADLNEGYHNGLKSFVTVYGKMLFHEITKEKIIGYRNNLANTLSNVSANRSLFVVKQLFKTAMEEELVFEDVTANIRYMNEKEHARTRFLLPDKLERLIKACEGTKAKYYMPALISLGAEHGASRQEALFLHWADIELDTEDLPSLAPFMR